MSKPKVLMIIAPDQFRDEELQVPRQAFLDQGWEVDTVSERTGKVHGMLGAVEHVSKDLAYAENQVKQNAYAAVVVVGGMGSVEFLWNNATTHRILNTMSQEGHLISAICLSGVVLAKAGLLAGKRATVWAMPESLAALEAADVIYTGEPVTIDGSIVTANGPDAAEEFASSVIGCIKALIPA